MADSDTLTRYCGRVETTVYLTGFVPGRTETTEPSQLSCGYCRDNLEENTSLCAKDGRQNSECPLFELFVKEVAGLEDIPK